MTRHVFFALALMATKTNGNMMAHDLPPDGNCWSITCDAGAHCVLPQDSQLSAFSRGLTEALEVEEDTRRLLPDKLYTFVTGDGFIGGRCRDTELGCQIFCEPQCSCTMLSESCIGQIPDGEGTPCASTTRTGISISSAADFTVYAGSVQGPDVLDFECTDEYATCQRVVSDDAEFSTAIRVSSPNDAYFVGRYTDCPEGKQCQVACDPRCTCKEVTYTSADSTTQQACVVVATSLSMRHLIAPIVSLSSLVLLFAGL